METIDLPQSHIAYLKSGNMTSAPWAQSPAHATLSEHQIETLQVSWEICVVETLLAAQDKSLIVVVVCLMNE